MRPTFKLLAVLWIILYTFSSGKAYTQQDICQFKKVIKNGWSEDNQTLNQKIIDLGKSEIPRIIKNLEQPLNPDENKSSIIPFPKFILTRDDYAKLFAYTRYLESKNKIEEIANLYIKSFKGVKQTKSTSYIPLIYIIVINMVINESFNVDLDKNIFDKRRKSILHETLSNILIINKDKLLSAINGESKITYNYINTAKIDGDYIIDEQHLKIFKKQWAIHESKYHSAFITAIENGTVEKFIQEKKKKRKSISITTHLKMKLLKLKLKLYHQLSIKIDKQDYITLSDYRIITDLIMNTKAIDNTTRDYFKIVNDNQKLLRELKEAK